MTMPARPASAPPDAGRRAVLETIGWLIDAPIGDIVTATGTGRGEARELKYLAQRFRVIQLLAEKRAGAVPVRSFWEGRITHPGHPVSYAGRAEIRGWGGLHDPAQNMDLEKINDDRIRLGLPIFVLHAGAS